MSNLVIFDATFKFVNLKSRLSLNTDLNNIPTQQWKNENSSLASQWSLRAFQLDREFIEMVVNTVKKTHFTRQATCNISLQSLLHPPLESCSSPVTKHL